MDHLNTELVRYSDPHCSAKLSVKIFHNRYKTCQFEVSLSRLLRKVQSTKGGLPTNQIRALYGSHLQFLESSYRLSFSTPAQADCLTSPLPPAPGLTEERKRETQNKEKFVVFKQFVFLSDAFYVNFVKIKS